MTEKNMKLVLDNYFNDVLRRKSNGHDTFIFDNAPFFYHVCKPMFEAFKNYQLKPLNDINIKSFSKLDFNQKAKLSKEFFKLINMNVNVDKETSNGTINPWFIREKRDFRDNFYGHGMVLKNGNGDVTYSDTGYVSDLIVLIHELGHFANRPTSGQKICVLSEGVALYTELLAYDYLSSLGYEKEVEAFRKLRMNEIYKSVRNCYNVIPIIITYKTYGSISREKFQNLFDNEYYGLLVNIKEEDDVYRFTQDVTYTFGFLLASYIYQKVKSDFTFTENVNVFNKAITSEDFFEALSILNLTSSLRDELGDSLMEYLNVNDDRKSKK